MAVVMDEFHRYWDGARRIPGVSEIMHAAGLTYLPGPAGDALSSAIAEGVCDAETYGMPSQFPTQYILDAQKLGTAVHKATDLFDNDNLKKVKLDDLTLSYLNGYRQFKKDYSFEVYASEERVFNPTYGYAGTLDKRGSAVNKLGKRLDSIVDLKCTFKIQPTCHVQLNAYERACVGGARYWKLVVHLNPSFDKGYKVIEIPDGDWPVFLNALSIFNWKRNKNLIKGW